jgi:hypothetical protein
LWSERQTMYQSIKPNTMEHSKSELQILERLQEEIKNIPPDYVIESVTLTLHQSLPINGTMCLPGFAGLDISIENNQVTILSYYDLGQRIEARGTLTQHEIAELAFLIQNYRSDPDTKTSWTAPPAAFGYCAYSLLGYSWERTANEIPLNLYKVYQKIKQIQDRIPLFVRP